MPRISISTATETGRYYYCYCYSLFLWFSIFSTTLSATTSVCKKNRLDYEQMIYIDETQTFSLRICCYIRRLWFAKLNSDWQLAKAPGLDWRSVSNLTLPGFDIPVSKCPNDTYLLDHVTNKHCTFLSGNMISLTKSLEQLPEFDQWYVTCYERYVPGGDSEGPPCIICKLRMFCTHQRRCNEIFLHRDIVNASSTSMTLVVSVGNLPFEADIWTKVVSVNNRNNNNNNNRNNNNNNVNSNTKRYNFDDNSDNDDNNDDKVSHYQDTARAPINRSLQYEIEGLQPNTWYRIMTCAVVKTPAKFRLQYSHVHLPDEQTFCLEVEGYYTWMSRSRPSTAASTSPCITSVLVISSLLMTWLRFSFY